MGTQKLRLWLGYRQTMRAGYGLCVDGMPKNGQSGLIVTAGHHASTRITETVRDVSRIFVMIASKRGDVDTPTAESTPLVLASPLGP